MLEFIGQVVFILFATIVTQAVGAGLDLWSVTVLSSIIVAAIWSVIVWGGFLFIDDIGDIF